MRRRCENCVCLKKPITDNHCALCYEHNQGRWMYSTAVAILCLFAIIVLSISGMLLFSEDAVGDVLGVPIEVPAPYEGGCDD